jgi:hypothetical protein
MNEADQVSIWTPERPSRTSAERGLAQGLIRRRVARRPSGDAAGRAAVVSPSIMELIELTGLLFCAGAAHSWRRP